MLLCSVWVHWIPLPLPCKEFLVSWCFCITEYYVISFKCVHVINIVALVALPMLQGINVHLTGDIAWYDCSISMCRMCPYVEGCQMCLCELWSVLCDNVVECMRKTLVSTWPFKAQFFKLLQFAIQVWPTILFIVFTFARSCVMCSLCSFVVFSRCSKQPSLHEAVQETRTSLTITGSSCLAFYV